MEVINRIDWTGESNQLIVAKERHKSGDVALFNPMTGAFVRRFKTKADRFYVVDVSGDWRVEIVVLKGNKVQVYFNTKGNSNSGRDRLWRDNAYQRNKMTWNYYSP